MTSTQRVLTALQHQEPDRVPFALPASMHPSRYMGLTIKEYFSRVDYLVRGQLMLKEKFGGDLLSGYPFAAIEMLGWGGDVIYYEQGPPNAGAPIIRKPESILSLEPPRVEDSPDLLKVLRATEGLKAAVGDEVPLAGIVVSPFSLPIMQMGFESYLDLIHQRPDLLQRLLRVNTEFCVAWGAAQVKAGAMAMVYYDPATSPTILPRDIVERYSLPVAREVISRLGVGVAMHLASGRGLPLVDDFVRAGAAVMSASANEDLASLKQACRGRLTLIGPLNALEMRHWSPEQAEAEVKRVIAKAGPGGGFVLSDNHGEIPFLVDDEVLLAIAEAVRRWGRYPLDWVSTYDG